ncbi:ankyrin repeat protein, putative [Trichomonas vaginalis G3]|uniref:Ankyrin repeat protein, putative n=1 Tax=Trichomonas vaginalis (strain ATCC PRA-98 / G3) TaxID=412133 RepID=A2GIR2_TRIV3|nr:spectrin binding [Trichomonas vaginalis G3]EAX82955.1 ankyrin repeat protein, putative [Trichomonas vaginalis G3]KAI5551379.1 spectrin binding [Trichomonas vaginalis G3]|eukprot:XP_001295885.1 ankyrin repeat protein [Trichomonas vaginalis G3]
MDEIEKNDSIFKQRLIMSPEISKCEQYDELLCEINAIPIQQIMNFVLTKFDHQESRYLFAMIIIFSEIRPHFIAQYANLWVELSKKRQCTFSADNIYHENPTLLRHILNAGGYFEDPDFEHFSKMNIPEDYASNSLEYILKYDLVNILSKLATQSQMSLKGYVTTNNSDFFLSRQEMPTLAFAALYGAENCFNLLLKYKPQVTMETCEMAARGGNINIINQCAKEGGTFEKGAEFSSLCHHYEAFDLFMSGKFGDQKSSVCNSARSMNIAVVFYLVNHGGDVNEKDNRLMSPLHYACKHSSLPIARILLEHGSLVNMQDSMKKTPLIYACAAGSVECVTFLIEKGADVNISDEMWKTPLHYAALSNCFKIADLLINAGAKIDSATEHLGDTPLHCACSVGSIDIALYLIQCGAKIDERCEYVGRTEYISGVTPLHVCCLHKYTRLAEELIKKGANLEAKAENRMRAIHIACKSNNIELIKLLVSYKCNLNVSDETCMRPIHYACLKGALDIVKYLFSLGVDALAKGQGGNTCLHFACMSDNDELVQFLLEKGLNPNVSSSSGKYPLHIACERDKYNMCVALIMAGSELNPEDAEHNHPFAYANSYEIQKLIINQQNATKCEI